MTRNYTPSDWGSISSDQGTWAACRGASSGTLLGGASNGTYYDPYYYNPGYSLNRNFFVFDTANLPDICTIVSATFSHSFSAKTGSGSRSYALYDTTCADTILSTDFDLVGTNVQSDTISIDTMASSTAVWTLNAAGLATINKTGTTKFVIRETTKDVGNVAPTEITYVSHAAGSPPTLAITITIPDLIMGTGVFTFTGIAVSLFWHIFNRTLAMGTGVYNLSGQALSFTKTKIMTMATGVYSLVGKIVSFIYNTQIYQQKNTSSSGTYPPEHPATYTSPSKNSASSGTYPIKN